MLSGVRAVFGALIVNLVVTGAAFAGSCSASDVVQEVAFFRDRMTLDARAVPAAAGAASAVVYVHRDDPRITASFQVQAVAPPDADVSRYVFAAEQLAKMRQTQFAAKQRGATVEAGVLPDDPVQWKVIYGNDPTWGQDRLVGQYGIYVSPTCLLTATIAAPEVDRSAGDAFRRRWNDLVAAMDDVRAAAARVGEPMRFASEDLSPKGTKAYLIGLGVPAFATALMFLLLHFFVAVGRPSMISRGLMGLVGLLGVGVLVGNAAGWLAGMLPVEMLLLLGVCSGVCIAGSALPARLPTLLATCVAGGSGIAMTGYATYGWVAGPELAFGIGGWMIFATVISGLLWGSARRLADVV